MIERSSEMEYIYKGRSTKDLNVLTLIKFIKFKFYYLGIIELVDFICD